MDTHRRDPSTADRSRFDEHNVVGTFGDMTTARQVVHALEARGVDAARIALEGDSADRATHRVDTAAQDHAMLREGRNTAALGIVVGGALGALLGFLAAGLLFGFPGGDGGSVAMALGMTLGLAVAGAAVGVAVSGYSRVTQGEAMEATYDPEPGPVQVGVHTPEASERDTAVAVFERHQPQQVEHFARDGRRLAAP